MMNEEVCLLKKRKDAGDVREQVIRLDGFEFCVGAAAGSNKRQAESRVMRALRIEHHIADIESFARFCVEGDHCSSEHGRIGLGAAAAAIGPKAFLEKMIDPQVLENIFAVI